MKRDDEYAVEVELERQIEKERYQLSDEREYINQQWDNCVIDTMADKDEVG